MQSSLRSRNEALPRYVLTDMIGNRMAPDQGRARGLYDEQLQRKQQEKALCRHDGKSERPALFQRPEQTTAGEG